MPSPTKLNAITARMTKATGVNSHGYSAMDCMFCALCSSTPHEITGARKPKPINDREVSARIIYGKEIDKSTII